MSVESAFTAEPVKLDATYTTPDHSHAMMEPFASIASWEGDKLTVWTSNQMIAWGHGDLAKTLGLPKEKVRLISPYVGGGFGGKLFLRADAVMAALGAKAAGRPVKVAMQRPLMANNATHRPATTQRIRIGATKDGHIAAAVAAMDLDLTDDEVARLEQPYLPKTPVGVVSTVPRNWSLSQVAE